MIKNILETSQKVAYKTIQNAFLHDKKSHAYLISASKGAPTKEMAIFLAQSFLCENPSPLACEECLTCIRVADGSYSDFILVDGSKATIKKEDVEYIQSAFSKTALENKGLKIYVIHMIEKATAGAINSLLKFLEDPTDDVVAILTTENINMVLDTIISRCQLLRLMTFSKQEIINEIQGKGVDHEDALILSSKYSDIEEIMEIYNNQEFVMIKDLVIETVIQIEKDILGLNYFIQKEVMPKIKKDKNNCFIYLDLLETLLQDVLKLSLGQEILFVNQKDILTKLVMEKVNVQKMIEHIMIEKNKIFLNCEVNLLLDSLFYKIVYNKGE
ncbi:MAG: hypothetical protein WC123_01100 [Bacilli bacterium]|nr:hypothetical protein [Bacilli bacterium]